MTNDYRGFVPHPMSISAEGQLSQCPEHVTIKVEDRKFGSSWPGRHGPDPKGVETFIDWKVTAETRLAECERLQKLLDLAAAKGNQVGIAVWTCVGGPHLPMPSEWLKSFLAHHAEQIDAQDINGLIALGEMADVEARRSIAPLESGKRSDFYDRNKIARPVPNAVSPSQLLDGRSREMILRCVFAHMKHERRWRGTFLWSWVGSVTGHGSGYSTQICHEMDWDPDMTISPKAELPRTAARSTRG